MGFLNDVKKLLFGAKSVAKSAGNKVVDSGMEAGGKFADNAGDALDGAKDIAGDVLHTAKDAASDALLKAKEVMENLGDNFSETAGPVVDKAKNFTEEVGGKVMDATAPFVDKTKTVAEDLGASILDKSGDAMNKAKNVAEDVGGKVIEAAGPMIEKTKGVAEDIGGKVMDVGGDAMERFKEVGEDVGKKAKGFFDEAQEAAAREAKGLDPFEGPDAVDQANAKIAKDGNMEDMVQKAKDLADRMDAKVKERRAGFSEAPRIEDNDKSLLDGKDDFFAKADRFARGDYHNEGEKPASEEMKIITDPAPEEINIDKNQLNDLLGSAPPPAPEVNDLIDDAIVLEEDKKDQEGSEDPSEEEDKNT